MTDLITIKADDTLRIGADKPSDEPLAAVAYPNGHVALARDGEEQVPGAALIMSREQACSVIAVLGTYTKADTAALHAGMKLKLDAETKAHARTRAKLRWAYVWQVVLVIWIVAGWFGG